MRLFLDAHISGRAIAGALRERGHDVRSADEERELDSWDDDRLLELTTQEDRLTVTFNIRDFPRIVGEWAEAGRHHAGCLLIVDIDHGAFGEILRLVDAALVMLARPPWPLYTRRSGAIFEVIVSARKRLIGCPWPCEDPRWWPREVLAVTGR